MNAPTAKRQPKVCGNCGRVCFPLSRSQLSFLNIMISRYGLRAARNWDGNGPIMGYGGHTIDREKTRAAKLIHNSMTFCSLAGGPVSLLEEHCFAWLPKTSQGQTRTDSENASRAT